MMDFDEYYREGRKPAEPPAPLFAGSYPAVAKQGQQGIFHNDSRYLGTPRGEMTNRGATTVRSADFAQLPREQ